MTDFVMEFYFDEYWDLLGSTMIRNSLFMGEDPWHSRKLDGVISADVECFNALHENGLTSSRHGEYKQLEDVTPNELRIVYAYPF